MRKGVKGRQGVTNIKEFNFKYYGVKVVKFDATIKDGNIVKCIVFYDYDDSRRPWIYFRRNHNEFSRFIRLISKLVGLGIYLDESTTRKDHTPNSKAIYFMYQNPPKIPENLRILNNGNFGYDTNLLKDTNGNYFFGLQNNFNELFEQEAQEAQEAHESFPYKFLGGDSRTKIIFGDGTKFEIRTTMEVNGNFTSKYKGTDSSPLPPQYIKVSDKDIITELDRFPFYYKPE